jgi:hypothetical protein
VKISKEQAERDDYCAMIFQAFWLKFRLMAARPKELKRTQRPLQFFSFSPCGYNLAKNRLLRTYFFCPMSFSALGQSYAYLTTQRFIRSVGQV